MAKTAALFLVCMAICTPLAAQNIAGSISGTVTDPSGGVIAGATVTVTSVTTGARLQTVSSERGTFEFLSLAPDTYDLRIEASGFKSLVRTGYKVFAQQKLDTGPIGMEIGQLSDTVTVSGRTETVQTVSSERAGLVDREQLRSLPLMAGDPLELVATLPGFVSPDGANFTFQAPQALREFTANGGRNSSKNYTIDGVVALNTRGNAAASVTLNANAV